MARAAGSGSGCAYEDLLSRIRVTRVVQAAAPRDYDTASNENVNLAAFRQHCHMLHDRDEHQRWRTLSRRKAMGDLFQGPNPTD